MSEKHKFAKDRFRMMADLHPKNNIRAEEM